MIGVGQHEDLKMSDIYNIIGNLKYLGDYKDETLTSNNQYKINFKGTSVDIDTSNDGNKPSWKVTNVYIKRSDNNFKLTFNYDQKTFELRTEIYLVTVNQKK